MCGELCPSVLLTAIWEEAQSSQTYGLGGNNYGMQDREVFLSPSGRQANCTVQLVFHASRD